MSYTSERTVEMNKRADEISALNVGDGLTVSLYTDAEAGTIIKKTAKTITMQEDHAKLDNWKPEIIPGGFAGHCVNQHEQKYTYERNERGSIIKVSLRTCIDTEGNERRMWKRSGTGVRQGGGNVYPGRRKFHDYNF